MSAERNLPIARDALNLLGRKAPPPAVPWSDELRATLVRVLATGPPAIPALEALDQRRLLERYLPEWAAVRNKPQRNPYHRFTVDRHLLEATANAATMAHRVSRVDLLLIGTLLHDIGKGFPGDHTEVGMVVVRDIGTRLGFSPRGRRHPRHPGPAPPAAARQRHPPRSRRPGHRRAGGRGGRGPDDPRPAGRAGRGGQPGHRPVGVGHHGRRGSWPTWSSGPAGCWPASPWPPPPPGSPTSSGSIMDTVRDQGVPALSIDDPTVMVVAADRSGLLAEVTGVLALHGLNVRSAVVAGEDGVAVEVFTVEPSRGRWPSAARLADDLAAIMSGTLSIETQLAERARTYRNERRAITPSLVSTQVTVDNNASATATVVEVRAEDVVGQLHRITQALVDCRLDVTSAKVSTFGSAVVDAFYVRGPDGEQAHRCRPDRQRSRRPSRPGWPSTPPAEPPLTGTVVSPDSRVPTGLRPRLIDSLVRRSMSGAHSHKRRRAQKQRRPDAGGG